MTTELILVRHGLTDDNLAGLWTGWRDTPLSPRGTKQAHLTAEAISRKCTIHQVYTSPLQRAFVTASILGEALGLDPIVHDGLKEINFGDVEGMTDLEFKASFPHLWDGAMDRRDPHFAWPSGESRQQFWSRAQRTMNEIVAGGRGKSTLVVTHGGVISSFLAEMLAGDAFLWPDYLVKNCSFTRLQLAGKEAVLIEYDACDHLNGSPAL